VGFDHQPCDAGAGYWWIRDLTLLAPTGKSAMEAASARESTVREFLISPECNNRIDSDPEHSKSMDVTNRRDEAATAP